MKKNKPPATLIVYIGNPILGNDRIGLIVGRRLEKEIGSIRYPAPIHIREFVGAPLDLVSELEGYGQLILIDSVVTGKLDPGETVIFTEKELCSLSGDQYTHGLNLPEAISLGRRFEMSLPDSIVLIGIEVGRISDFGEKLDPVLEECLEDIYKKVKDAVVRFTAEGGADSCSGI